MDINQLLNNTTSVINSQPIDSTEIQRENTIMFAMDDFHTEIQSDLKKYVKWFMQQSQRNLTPIRLNTLINMRNITNDNFIAFYLTMTTLEYKNKILLKHLKYICIDDHNHYTKSFLKIVDDVYVFKYVSEFVW